MSSILVNFCDIAGWSLSKHEQGDYYSETNAQQNQTQEHERSIVFLDYVHSDYFYWCWLVSLRHIATYRQSYFGFFSISNLLLLVSQFLLSGFILSQPLFLRCIVTFFGISFGPVLWISVVPITANQTLLSLVLPWSTTNSLQPPSIGIFKNHVSKAIDQDEAANQDDYMRHFI